MTEICTGKLDQFTYDAMWCLEKAARVEVPDIRPDDSHIHKEYNLMSESTPSDIPISKMTPEQMFQKVEELLNGTPPEVQQTVEKGKGFYNENKRAIHAVVVGAIVLRVYKKKVAKTTAKAVVKALAKSDSVKPLTSTFPTMFDIWNDLKETPGLAYIPHGGGMVHLLGPSKDVIVTVFGNFEKMNTEDIFAYAGRALRMRNN